MAGKIVADIIETPAGRISLNVGNTVVASINAAGIFTSTGNLIITQANQLGRAALPAGSVLQVVSATKTDTFSTASTSLVDVTGLSVSITPTSATSKILVFVVASGGGLIDVNGMNLALLRGATQIALGDASGSRSRGFGGNQQINNAMHTNTTVFLDSPATTSATTYKVQASVNTGTGYINRNHNDADSSYNTRGVSSITVMEIAA